jgi:hypothetical protein
MQTEIDEHSLIKKITDDVSAEAVAKLLSTPPFRYIYKRKAMR